MDKKLIERIALEVAQEAEVLDADGECPKREGVDITEYVLDFANRFLARIDAERGKDAVPGVYIGDMGITLCRAGHEKGPRLFLSPTIPEGMALVHTEILDRFPEINPSNYDHDDACRLNAWGVELVLAAQQPPAPCQCANENTDFLMRRIEQFDRAITRIGHHVGAVCAGVDTEDEHGAGGHSAASIIGKFDELHAEVERLTKGRWCPEVCPITGRPFFMWVEHYETGRMVPTYGGPFDSYTIPIKGDDGEFVCERYDHDAGAWIADEVIGLGLRLCDDQHEDYEFGTLAARDATLAQQTAQIKGLGEALTRQHNSGEEIAAQCMRAEEKVEQQAERIAELEADNKAAWATADRHMTERNEARERIAELEKECGSNLRMFQAAILDLASISEVLDCDPDDGGAAPIIEAIDELKARIADQPALIDRLKQEAQMHAQEARTANSTIHEIYQVISGATGEPGNWNGAEPVRAYVKAQVALIEKCRSAMADIKQQAMTSYGENNENYIEDECGELCYIVPHEPMLEIDEALAAIAAQKGSAA